MHLSRFFCSLTALTVALLTLSCGEKPPTANYAPDSGLTQIQVPVYTLEQTASIGYPPNTSCLLLDADGTAIPNQRAELYSIGIGFSMGSIFHSIPGEPAAVVTDSQGKFTIPLTPYSFELGLQFTDFDGVLQIAPHPRQEGVPGERTFSVQSQKTRTGKLSTADGSRLANSTFSYSAGLAFGLEPLSLLNELPPGSFATKVDDWSWVSGQSAPANTIFNPLQLHGKTDHLGSFTSQFFAGSGGVFLIENGRIPHYIPLPEDHEAELHLQTHPREEFRFRVVDRKGDPAIGAEVAIAYSNCIDSDIDILIPHGIVPADGWISAMVEQPNYCTLAARWSSHDPWLVRDSMYFDPNYHAGQWDLFVLSQPQSARIRVLLPDGSPAAGAKFAAVRLNQFLSFDEPLQVVATFDEVSPGIFESDRIPPCDWAPLAFLEGWLPTLPEEGPTGALEGGYSHIPTDELTLILHEAKQLKFRITNGETGLPVAGVIIGYTSTAVDQHHKTGPLAMTGPDGVAVIPNACVNIHEFEIDTLQRKFEVKWDGESEEVVFEVPSKTSISIQCINQGKPFPNASLSLRTTPHYQVFRSIKADQNGFAKLDLPWLEDEELEITWTLKHQPSLWDSHSGTVVLQRSFPYRAAPTAEITLNTAVEWQEPTAKITGQITLNRSPAVGAILFKLPADTQATEKQTPQNGLPVKYSRQRKQAIALDDQGGFAVNLPVGKVEIEFQCILPGFTDLGTGTLHVDLKEQDHRVLRWSLTTSPFSEKSKWGRD